MEIRYISNGVDGGMKHVVVIWYQRWAEWVSAERERVRNSKMLLWNCSDESSDESLQENRKRIAYNIYLGGCIQAGVELMEEESDSANSCLISAVMNYCKGIGIDNLLGKRWLYEQVGLKMQSFRTQKEMQDGRVVAEEVNYSGDKDSI